MPPAPPHTAPDVVILAAGEGRRFGGQEHKSLVPLLFGSGTLPLLLRQLHGLGHRGRICVVTGHKADAVARAVAEHLPTALCVPVTGGGPGTILRSIATGLTQPELTGPGAVVLFADSLYHQEALERMLSVPVDVVAVAAEPWRGDADHPVGLLGDGTSITAVGPDAADAVWMMAPAIHWPRALWGEVARAVIAGMTAQWQLLHDLLRNKSGPSIHLVPLMTGDIVDIDTPAELNLLRNRLLGPDAVSYFRSNLSKDERNLAQPDMLCGGQFLKVCQNKEEAAHEFTILKWLRQQPGEALVPVPHSAVGKHLTLEHVQGIRLYDLFRILRAITDEADAPLAAAADRAATTLLSRCMARLQRLQAALASWPGAAALPAYPLHTHLRDLLALLTRLLLLLPLSPCALRELDDLQACWEAHDACVPFRDATPKNILVAVPMLAPHRRRAEQDRHQAVVSWLEQPDAAARVDLVDYDFTSTRHRTAPEDDLISLLGHMGSRDTAVRLLQCDRPAAAGIPATVAWLDWLRNGSLGFTPNPARAARALLVRYLRFGGRKLAYRMINPTGYAIRFRHDDPAPYFRDLPACLRALDPDFAARWPALTDLLSALAAATSKLPPWNARELALDPYLATQPRSVHYWQESPLEQMGVPV